ncbi:MAG: hypothetical protein KAI73_11060 [Rhodospirillaceae bacterium]|nr:hypothetical protein [Rhodospirillaceae bacterium]
MNGFDFSSIFKYGASQPFTPVFRTWDDLAARLAVSALGTVGILIGRWGALPVCVCTADGIGGVDIIGVLNLDSCDDEGSQFTIGPGLNIESLTGGTPVQPTLSSAGLIVTDVEGVVQLNFYRMNGFIQVIKARYNCAIPNEVDGQALAVGSTIFVYGGVYRHTTGPQWMRQSWQSDPPAAIGSPNINVNVVKPDGEAIVGSSLAENTSTTAVSTGISRDSTDPAPAGGQSTVGNIVLGTQLSAASRYARLLCIGQGAADFSAVVEKINTTSNIL